MKNIYLTLIFGLTIIITSLNLSAQSGFYFDPQAVEGTVTTNNTVVVHTLLNNMTDHPVEFSFPGYTTRDQGGPDDYGYSWIDSDEDGGPNYEWNDISETGIAIEGLTDDNVAGPFEMAINFPFYGQSKHLFWVSPNGAISFNDQFLAFVNSPIPTNNNYIDFIAWCWDDLMFENGMSSVYYQNYDEKTVVQFNKMVHYPGSEEFITAQVIMLVNGKIFIRYKQVTEGFETNGATVGLQSWNPEMGLQVACNQEYLHSELAVRFDLNRNFIVSVSPASGTLPADSHETIWITYSSTGFEVGSYEQELQCISNLPEYPEIYLHNVMHVTNPEQAGFQGFVTDAATGLPINDVMVAVGDHSVYTNGDGHYELALEPGSYDVHFTREGYQPKIVEDTTAGPGFTTLDVELGGYYFLVGRVFAGENHIETGFAYGYKMHEGTVVDIYAEMVGPEGWFEFTGLASAQYIVKAEPSPNSIYYGDYLPTYYGDVLHWEEATVINLVQSTDDAHIHLIPVESAPVGPGSISGTIENARAANIPIVLRSAEPGTAVMTYSSTDGSYMFNNLSFGSYEIFAEIPGKTINPMNLTLDESHPDIQGVEMIILDDQIIFTMGIEESEIFRTVSAIYPNPVMDKLNMMISVKKPVIVNVQIADIVGRTIQSSNFAIDGTRNIEIGLDYVPAGIYTVRCEAMGQVIVNKFIKK